MADGDLITASTGQINFDEDKPLNYQLLRQT